MLETSFLSHPFSPFFTWFIILESMSDVVESSQSSLMIMMVFSSFSWCSSNGMIADTTFHPLY